MIHPFPIVEKNKDKAVPIYIVQARGYGAWVKEQPSMVRHWLKVNGFKGAAGTFCLIPAKDGTLAGVACGADEKLDIWSLAHLPGRVPAETYYIKGKFSPQAVTQMALGWALATYKFTRYKKNNKNSATLIAPKGCDLRYVKSMAASIGWARDMINTPANDMNPEALACEAVTFAHEFDGKVSVTKGEALLRANYPMIYTVGKASSVPPHLVDIKFPRRNAPMITLVGKGVCFDSGGLDIKSTANMKLMKKDMGGAAAVLALARAIMETKLPVQLRVLLPIVENAIGGNAMRPLDIVPTRKGITVEIGNTDAEGRLILCDALFEADEEEPDLIIDCSTLTGAARVALGADIPVFFTPNDKLAADVMKAAGAQHDPMWRLPLWKDYRRQLDTPSADLSNDPDSGYGGAITAALYLQEFVSRTNAWLHIDMMAWNLKDRPGRPQGGEAMAIRALYAMIKEKYSKNS